MAGIALRYVGFIVLAGCLSCSPLVEQNVSENKPETPVANMELGEVSDQTSSDVIKTGKSNDGDLLESEMAGDIAAEGRVALDTHATPPSSTLAKALYDRNSDDAAAINSSSQRTLFLHGGVTEGRLRIEPAFVLDAPAALPEQDGPYSLVGTDSLGGELFALRFAMMMIAHKPGSGGFHFAIPVEDNWAESLATITLSGPEGSVALVAGDMSRPAMIIVLDKSTGRVVAILRESEEDPLPPGVHGPSTITLMSRGIPSPSDWRR